MEITVLLEPQDGQGYRATSLLFGPLVAEAPTREEALAKLREAVEGRLEQGEVLRLQVAVPGEAHAWAGLIGRWRHHPDAGEVERNMAEYRRQVDADPDRL
jgi:hypothetical protein